MNCPWCATPMTPVQLGTVTIDRCGACGGRWFDRNEIEAAVRGARKADSAATAERPVPENRTWPDCSRDGTPLTAYRTSQAGFGRCPECQGVLLTDEAWAGMLDRRFGKRDAVGDVFANITGEALGALVAAFLEF